MIARLPLWLTALYLSAFGWVERAFVSFSVGFIFMVIIGLWAVVEEDTP